MTQTKMDTSPEKMAESSSAKGPAAADLSAYERDEAPFDAAGLDTVIPKGEVDSVYEAKARILNAAVSNEGRGKIF